MVVLYNTMRKKMSPIYPQFLSQRTLHITIMFHMQISLISSIVG